MLVDSTEKYCKVDEEREEREKTVIVLSVVLWTAQLGRHQTQLVCNALHATVYRHVRM